jgi:hypothetical protein
MPDGAALSLEAFAGCVGEPFEVVDAGEGLVVELRLESTESLGPSPGEGFRAPFSLSFSGPPSPILPQRIYALRNDTLGSLSLFLIPRQPGAGGARYEVIFN